MTAQHVEMPKAKSLPIECWPHRDREAWSVARRPAERLKRGGAGGHMKAITLNDLQRRYGYLLDFLQRTSALDRDGAAGSGVTPANIEAFLQELKSRVGSVTLYGTIYKIRRACQLIDPARDLCWLIEIENDLALTMRPKSKADRWVLSEILVEAGLALIAEADTSTNTPKLTQARQVRNGLMIAMLALYPIRLKNFAALELGRNLVENKGSWWIVLSAAETKESRADERQIHDFIGAELNLYLLKYRPTLVDRADGPSNALWLSSNDGSAMSYSAVEHVVTETSRLTTGVRVSPHLFRTAGASTAAIHGGADPHLASAVLHHTGPQVTQQNYNRASSLAAGNRFREIIEGYMKN